MYSVIHLLPPTEAPAVDEFGYYAIEAIIEWFEHNFEEPANETPYTKEDGYLYVWGGPFDAREEITRHFPHLDDELIEEAVSRLGLECSEWAPAGWRITQEKEDEEPPSPIAAYEALTARLDELEAVVNELKPSPHMIGHNNPPENVGTPPYYDEDREFVRQAITVLRQQSAEAISSAEEVKKTKDGLQRLHQKLFSYLAEKGDIAVTNFAESFGTTAGKMAARGLLLLAAKLAGVLDALTSWLQTLGL